MRYVRIRKYTIGKLGSRNLFWQLCATAHFVGRDYKNEKFRSFEKDRFGIDCTNDPLSLTMNVRGICFNLEHLVAVDLKTSLGSKKIKVV